jgi:apolipoprotein N-acyltransferase
MNMQPAVHARSDVPAEPTSWGRALASAPAWTHLTLAVGVGLLLRRVVSLEPNAWLAWLVPAALLALALVSSAAEARGTTLLAALIGCSTHFAYYKTVLSTPVAIAFVLAQALLWLLAVSEARRVMLALCHSWTVVAYPVLWVAIDTLMASGLRDGNFGSLAYSQAEFLPLLQVAALFGSSGVLFLLALGSAALARCLVFGRRVWRATAFVGVLLTLAVGFGLLRLRALAPSQTITYGLVAIDDAIGLAASPGWIDGIRRGYEAQVADLAQRGAAIVLLPEKIAVASPRSALAWQTHWAQMARRHGIWLVASLTVADGNDFDNLAYVFSPAGARVATHVKHHLAPVERGYRAGHDYTMLTLDGIAHGVGICKDLHFASFGRAYGQRAAAVMLVPAWDFGVDRWMGSRMSVLRGVESGFAVVRVAREGLLTVSDPNGRVWAETPSRALPGASLLARVAVPNPTPTLFVRTGNLLGWLCVAAAPVLAWAARRRERS